MENVGAIAESAGYSMSDCARVTVYLSDLSLFADVNSVYSTFFTEPYPARSCFAVAGIPKGASMEIDAIFVDQREK